MHELLVMPCRNMSRGRRRLRRLLRGAGRCAAASPSSRARRAGRATSSSTARAVLAPATASRPASCIFDQVFVPWERVFFAGEWEHSAALTYSYATHHRHTCIGARAGFGDLLIGAGALMCEANGFDPGEQSQPARADGRADQDRRRLLRLRRRGQRLRARATRTAGIFMPEPVFANIGKLLLATQIYDMHRLAHEVSGGLIVALPGPDEDHNPATAATLSEVLRANPDVPYDKRIEVARFIEDLTASYQGGWYSVISLHGGGSPAAMKQEIWRNYPVGNKVELVERLLERGVLARRRRARSRATGSRARCCDQGCARRASR